MADGHDSSTMTIEFLRARLLSERSVSRSARQRADQLAKRVTELEEQLRMVTIQRKKAERAATEVLSVLESHGIGNFCKVMDSSSDKDENAGLVLHSTEGGNMREEDDSSNASGMQNRSEVDDGCSGSEVEVSPSQGRSLSWKGSKNGSESLERKKLIQTRQGMRIRAFIYSPEFSSKLQMGKSCRKLKRSDSTDMVGNKTNANELGMDSQVKENGDVYAKEESNSVVHAKQGSYNGDAEHIEGCGSVGEQNNYFNSNFYTSGVDKEEEMELALEKQAQLIDLYQAEENAQREWEEKFNENHSKMASSQWDKNPPMTDGEYVLIEKAGDACNGNVSHVEGKSAEQTATAVRLDAVTSDMTLCGISSNRNCSSKGKMALTAYHAFNTHALETNCSGNTPNGETGGIDQGCTSSTAAGSENVSQEFEFPGQAAYSGRSNTNRVQESVGNCSDGISDRSINLSSNVHRPVGNHKETVSSVKCSKEQSSERQIQLHLHSRSHDGSSLEVLGSLQRAKLSLVKQLSRNPQQTGKTWESASDSRALAVQQKVPEKDLNVPIGSNSLFRLPTDPLPSSYLLGSTSSYLRGSTGINPSLAERQYHADFEFRSNSDPYLERTFRTPVRPQGYDYRGMSANPPLPVNTTRYTYPFLDSYPTSNISSSRTHMPHMDLRDVSSQNPYMIRKIDGVDPSWRIP